VQRKRTVFIYQLPALSMFGCTADTQMEEAMLGSAKTRYATSTKFYIMGISLRTWQEGENLANVLLDNASNGCDVRFLLTHPENPALTQLINEGSPDEQVVQRLVGRQC
jgi:hypothetical protein